MNSKLIRFVVVWELSQTLEAAAAFLGMRLRSMTRQANRLRAAGVKLKSLTDPRFGRYSTNPKGPLTPAQQAFMVEHFEFARNVAAKTVRSMDVPRPLVADLVEDAAVEALIQTARRSSAPDFIPQSVRGLLTTVVRRQVFDLIRTWRPTGHSTSRPDLSDLSSKRFASPVEEAMRREERELRVRQDILARSFIGDFRDMTRRRIPEVRCEEIALRAKAREHGLGTDGDTDELRNRLADYFRAKLDQLNTPPADREQQEAERFVRTWETASTMEVVAARLGWTIGRVRAWARRLIGMGVQLKAMPTQATHRVVVQSVMSMSPSRN